MFVPLLCIGEEEEIDPLTWRQIKNLEIEAETDRDLAFQLGYAYLQGSSGLPKNLERGEQVLTELSERYPVDENVGKASFILGKLFFGAENHPIDREKALAYFRVASQFAQGTGLEEAPYQVASMVENDDEYIEYMEMWRVGQLRRGHEQLESAQHLRRSHRQSDSPGLERAHGPDVPRRDHRRPRQVRDLDTDHDPGLSSIWARCWRAPRPSSAASDGSPGPRTRARPRSVCRDSLTPHGRSCRAAASSPSEAYLERLKELHTEASEASSS